MWVPLGEYPSSRAQNISPYCPKQPLYRPYMGGICWYISRVLSQGYPTFFFDICVWICCDPQLDSEFLCIKPTFLFLIWAPITLAHTQPWVFRFWVFPNLIGSASWFWICLPHHFRNASTEYLLTIETCKNIWYHPQNVFLLKLSRMLASYRFTVLRGCQAPGLLWNGIQDCGLLVIFLDWTWVPGEVYRWYKLV